MKINLKPITATIGDKIHVSVMNNELDVQNPMIHFYAAVISCVTLHVKATADWHGLDSLLIDVELSGHIENSVFEDIGITINTNQDHSVRMPLAGAVMNCPVLQHMDSDIDINVVVN